MSNTMIVEFAHKRIRELHEEMRDMERIIEAFTPHNNLCTERSETERSEGVMGVNGKMVYASFCVHGTICHALSRNCKWINSLNIIIQ
jgi:hypothetical protein